MITNKELFNSLYTSLDISELWIDSWFLQWTEVASFRLRDDAAQVSELLTALTASQMVNKATRLQHVALLKDETENVRRPRTKYFGHSNDVGWQNRSLHQWRQIIDGQGAIAGVHLQFSSDVYVRSKHNEVVVRTFPGPYLEMALRPASHDSQTGFAPRLSMWMDNWSILRDSNARDILVTCLVELGFAEENGTGKPSVSVDSLLPFANVKSIAESLERQNQKLSMSKNEMNLARDRVVIVPDSLSFDLRSNVELSSRNRPLFEQFVISLEQLTGSGKKMLVEGCQL
jgi:hypothetical protein